jgi:hypothetical protein
MSILSALPCRMNSQAIWILKAQLTNAHRFMAVSIASHSNANGDKPMSPWLEIVQGYGGYNLLRTDVNRWIDISKNWT